MSNVYEQLVEAKERIAELVYCIKRMEKAEGVYCQINKELKSKLELAPVNLATFLAESVMTIQDAVIGAYALPENELMDYLMLKIPIMQGMSVQMKLKKLGEKEYDKSRIGIELEQALKEN